MDERTAVFIISVAARLVAMHPSTLRKYESCGLLEPCRPTGRLRLYSIEDVTRLQQIKTLVEDKGINLAGVKLALALTDKANRLRELSDGGESSNGSLEEVRAIAEDMLAMLGSRCSVSSDRGSDRAVDEPD
jgi:MerR family transcriptional regulator/heat shock protein HspR